MTLENGRGDPNEDDVLSILVATDNHLGYMEKDPIRGADSFEAFDEILQIANERNVDMILLGGDLFHDNRPSHNSLVRCMESLRTHCWGSRSCSLELLSDPAETFMTKFSMVNYMDPNVNVNIPVFSIHGNHDDPSGEGNYASLDMLAVAGLVNYFGKQENADDVSIKPVLLRKGNTHLAMYGLGNIRDERLHRTFLTRKVKMMRPSENTKSWFNLMVLHQNRVQHGAKNYIPENFLESFIDLVVWGHEHECLIDPIINPDRNFHVSQPGSSVATALSEGEAVPKHIGILKVCGRKFQMEKIRLRSVRPFVMDEVVLSNVDGLRPTDQRAVNECLSEKVQEMIEKANEEWLELHSTNDVQPEGLPPKPLIRLKVEYSGGFNVFNPQRFGQQFVDLAANPRDLLVFYRKRTTLNPELRRRKRADADELAALTASLPDQLQSLHVADLVDEYLEAQNLNLLPENELGAAVKDYVDKDLRDAIKCFVDDSLKRTRQEIQPTLLVGDDEGENVALQRNILHAKEKRRDEYEQLPDAVKNKGKEKARARDADDAGASLIDDDDSFGAEEEPPKSSRGRTATKRGATRGRGKAATTAARGRAKATPSRSTRKAVESEEEEEEEIMDDDVIEEENFAGSPSEDEEPSSSRKRKAPEPKIVPTGKRPAAAASTSRRGRGRGKAPAATSSTRQSQLAFAPVSTSKSKSTNRAPASIATLAFRPPVTTTNNEDDDDDDGTFEDFAMDQQATLAPGRTRRR